MNGQDGDEGDGRGRQLFVPMHADNWALALTAAYLGTPLREDAARDVQALVSSGIVAFAGGVPEWAFEYGDPGPKIVLELRQGIPRAEEGDLVHVEGFRRVCDVAAAIFHSADDLANFNASYSAFPDVPVALVPCRVGQVPVVRGTEAATLQPVAENNVSALSRRFELDWYGGWAAGICDLARNGRFDNELAAYLAAVPKGGRTVYSVASALLSAMHPEAEAVDQAIWGTVVEVTSLRRAGRGFDKTNVLSEVAERIQERITPDQRDAVNAWVETCRKVVKALVDPPPLDDRRRLGQRAALAVLLAPDARAAASLDQSLSAGARVKALATVAARAFDGLARLEAVWKSDCEQLDALLEIAEGLGEHTFALGFSARTLTSNFEGRDAVLLDGKILVERRLPPKPHELILRARATEAGLDLRVDGRSGCLCFEPAGRPGTVVLVEEDAASSPSEPIIRFVLPLTPLAPRTPKSLQLLLETAWKHGSAVGLRGGEMCAFAARPTATLDRGEFEFDIGRMLEVHDAVAASLRRNKARKSAPPA